MSLSRLLIVIVLLGLVLAPPLRAQTDASPYTVTVPVKDISEAERDNAFGAALSQVLTRVAGGQDLRGKSGYDDALKKAPGIVHHYQYQRSGGVPPGLSLQVTFDQGAVQHAIAGMGVANTGKKPPVLAIVHNASGRTLNRAALTTLTQAAAAQGYTVITAGANSTLDPDALKKADPIALATVSQQYKTGLVLLGELHDGGADWTLLNGGQSQSWQSAATTSDDVLLSGAGTALADHVGTKLNVIGTSDSAGELWVSDVRSAMDYVNLLAMLRANPVVRQVNTVRAKDDGMLFDLKAGVPLNVLAAHLAADGRLLQGAPHDGADASLRWVH